MRKKIIFVEMKKKKIGSICPFKRPKVGRGIKVLADMSTKNVSFYPELP